jgi:O-antigen/teichoic acid export membrane protein
MSIVIAENIQKSDSVPSEKLTQKAYLNSVAYLLEYGTRIAVGFVVTPILLSGLGSVLFGVWQILNRLLSHIPAASGRTAQALTLVVANRQGSEDFAEKKRNVGSALAIWALFLPLFISAGIIIIWLSPSITKVAPEMHSVVRLTSALLVINFLIVGLIAVPEAVLRGSNLGYKRMWLMAGVVVVGGVLTAGAIYSGLGLKGVAGAQVIVSFLTGIIFLFLVKKYVTWFGVNLPSISEIKQFFGISGWYTLWTLVNKLLLVSDVVILGIVASATAVTTYTLTGYAAQLVISVISIIIQGAVPGLGGVIGKKLYDKAANLRGEMMAINWLLVTAVGASILLWNRSFISLWVGIDQYAGFWPNLFIVLVVVQIVFIRNDSFVIDLTLDLRRKVILGAIAAIISIGLAVILIPTLGIVGLCVGLLGGRLLLSIYYPAIICSFLGKSFRNQLKGLIRPLFLTGIIFAGSGYLGEHMLAGNWFEWVVYSSTSFGLILYVSFASGLAGRQRRQVLERFKSIRLFNRNVS